ncbi:MAG TPA: ribose-5-phosphate isomerase RpiA [Armatimonadota bacterium]|nr:ribose-5-phosphate isomerase RpiA [Armatimonadota bacterium]
MADHIEQLKREAAEYAVGYIKSGMTIGLGHGSTVSYTIPAIADKLQRQQISDIKVVPCSHWIEQRCRSYNIPIITLEETLNVDMTIDGADEVTENMNMIKGSGGALLREKIVAQVTRQEIIIVDERKITSMLGTRARIPIEIDSFGWRTQIAYLATLGAKSELRCGESGKPFITDAGHWILDCAFGKIPAPEGLALQLQRRAGILAHGLFLGLANEIIIAESTGIRVLKQSSGIPPEGAESHGGD